MGKKQKKSGAEPGVRMIAHNRRARFDYELGERFEAGLVLRGSEVKSLRQGKGSLAEAYATVDESDEGWLVNASIPEYAWTHHDNHAPSRRRKLLLHARELHRIGIKLRERGYTLVPLRLYFRDARVKVEIALARGKKTHDKRDTIRQRDQDREMQRQLR